ncbi:mast cell carboxypeptidase A-like [Ascaphus truei]|uniref:mast cell carboxypeptidase A-like n=1 Tax=Ascaphus truei TaxID=8439 RepID=UPI003F59AB83
MRNMKLLLLFLWVPASLSIPTNRRFDNEKVFRVIPKNNEEVDFIRYLDSTLQLDFWTPESSYHVTPNTVVNFHTNAEESETVMGLFEQKRINYKIIFQNLQELIENQFNKPGQLQQKPFGSTGGYYTWKKISSWAHSVSEMNPKLVSCIEIGKTYEGRPMLLLKVGSQKSNKKTIFLECGIHAREWVSPAFCQWFVNEAVRTYGKDKTMTKLLDNVNFHVLPVFNIDGYVWTWTRDRMWRKNRFPNPNSKCVGTDLNRNFNASWGTIDTWATPCSQIYPGSAPESAEETKAVTAYIRNNLSSIKAFISFHAYSQLLLYPYAYTEKEPPNHEKLNEIAKSAVKALFSLYGTNYTYGPIASTIYPAAGSSIDWTYDEGIKYSFVFELRDEGEYGFLLPENQIKPTCKETMLAVKEIASYVLSLED